MSGIMLNFAGVSAASVPGAPTIGTATATGITSATVSYTAPANNGGSVITSYTATSSPGGITGTLSQAGSGTITVNGLNATTSYTFTVTATNAVGTSSPSSSSNSITTQSPVIGDSYGGGFYAGQISTSANGVATHNIIVGPVSSAQSTKEWKTTSTSTAGTSSVIDGPTNSSNMNNSLHPAAQFCESLTIGGFSDWYMPAKNELEICYYNLKPTTTSNVTSSGTNTNAVPSRGSNYSAGTPAQTSATNFKDTGTEDFGTGFYWSSTEFSASGAWLQRFSNGQQPNYVYFSKPSTVPVRAIRRIAV